MRALGEMGWLPEFVIGRVWRCAKWATSQAVARPCAGLEELRSFARACDGRAQWTIFLCLPRAERNQHVLFVKNESIKFCCSGGFSNVPDVMEASVLFISTVFHVRSVSCRCLYLGFRAPCATRVTRVTCSKRSLLGVPLELA